MRKFRRIQMKVKSFEGSRGEKGLPIYQAMKPIQAKRFRFYVPEKIKFILKLSLFHGIILKISELICEIPKGSKV